MLWHSVLWHVQLETAPSFIQHGYWQPGRRWFTDPGILTGVQRRVCCGTATEDIPIHHSPLRRSTPSYQCPKCCIAPSDCRTGCTDREASWRGVWQTSSWEMMIWSSRGVRVLYAFLASQRVTSGPLKRRYSGCAIITWNSSLQSFLRTLRSPTGLESLHPNPCPLNNNQPRAVLTLLLLKLHLAAFLLRRLRPGLSLSSSPAAGRRDGSWMIDRTWRTILILYRTELQLRYLSEMTWLNVGRSWLSKHDN